jgi:Na+/H+-dicarboxylate symporter
MLAFITGKKTLPLRILVGFILGIAVGFLFTDFSKAIKPLGDVFISLIKMIIVPVIFFTVAGGIANMGDMQKLKRVGGKVMLIYVTMTVLSCVIGLVVALLLRPGLGITMAGSEAYTKAVTTPTIGKFLLGMVPNNAFGALATGDVMQVFVFTTFVGIALVIVGDKAAGLKDLMDQGARVCFVILDIVMEFSPIGVFALMANSVAIYGAKIFGAMGKFILADYISIVVIWFLLLSLPLIAYTKIDYFRFVKHLFKIWVVTLSTCSSAATLPLTMKVAREDLKIPAWLVNFSIPLGCTVNLTGAAMYKSVLVVFAADFYGISLSIEQMIITVLISSLLSIAAPGIPGGGIVMGAIMLNLLSLPYDIIGPIAGIYRLIDMGHTTMNVSGDVVGTLLVAKNEGVWSNEIFVNESEAQNP